MSYLSPSLTLLINAVKKASGSLNRDFSEIEQLQSSVKGYKEFVVASYTKVSKALQVELGKIHPDYALVSEAEKLGAHNCYIVSPIDGLSNFAHGIPHFAVSVAVYENNTVTASVVYNPATDCLYFAEKGKGAYKEGFRNHERLRVSSRRDLKELRHWLIITKMSANMTLFKSVWSPPPTICAFPVPVHWIWLMSHPENMTRLSAAAINCPILRPACFLSKKQAVISMILTKKTNGPRI